MHYSIVGHLLSALRRYDWRLRYHVIMTDRYRRIPFTKNECDVLKLNDNKKFCCVSAIIIAINK